MMTCHEPGDSARPPGDALALPRLVLGTSHVDRLPLERAFRVFDHAVARGVAAIDCAAAYGDGRSDAVVSRWLAASGARDGALLIAKGGLADARGSRIHPDALAHDLGLSLERLGTAQLDAFVLHRDDEQVPVGEIIDALDAHVRAGQVRVIGASNWSVARIRAANEYADARGRARLAISSPQFSLAVPRTPAWPGCLTLSGHGRAGDRAWYAASDVTVLAWSPLGAGFLVGAAGPEVSVYDHDANRARRRRLVELARARGVSPAAVALAYVLSAEFRVSAVIRCATPEELDDCCGALDLALSPDDRAALDGPRLATPPATRGVPRARVYDAIVVGSGATGGWAAMELTRAGMHVLVVEAGPERDPVLASRVPAPPRPARRQRIQSLHPDHASFPPELFVDDEDEPYRAPADAPFAWIRGRQLGGRTLTWGGLALRMSDFELAPRDGAGPDWPLGYAELAPWYDRVERFHGVRGHDDGLPQLPAGAYLPPAAMTPAERRLKAALEAHWPDRRLIHARAMPRDEVHPVSGWPVHASPGSTLMVARDTGRLSLWTDAAARRLIWNRDTGRVQAVEIFDRALGRAEEVRGRFVVLCASTIETTRLLLHSRSDDWPDGLGNASGVLGRYLMDHPFTVVTGWTAAPDDDREMRPFGGAHSVAIPRFRNLGRRELDAPRGYGLWGGVQRGPARARDEAEAEHEVPVELVVQAEMLPRPDNRVELDPDARDPWGMPLPRITCRFGAEEEALLGDGLAFLDELGEVADIEWNDGSGRLRPPGLFVHEVGTARMGADRRTSFLNRWNQSWEIGNLFVCDGACFPSSGWQNPTLTMMALTARCCSYIVEQSRRLDL